MLVYYQLYEIKKYDFRVDPNSISCKISSKSSGSQIESCGQTNMVSPICIHFVHIMQRMHNNSTDVRKMCSIMQLKDLCYAEIPMVLM
jgi:hypothetical protein